MLKKYMLFFETIVLIAIVLLFILFKNRDITERLMIDLNKNVQSIKAQDYTLFDNMISITPVTQEFYLLANYKNISLLNLNESSITVMKPYYFKSDTHQLTPFNNLYVPTGLFYSKVNKKLYVANYTGNNVLVFDIDLTNKLLIFEKSISSQHMISPENIALSTNGKILVSANYDGNSVTALNISNQPFEMWFKKIPNAHGIAILDNYVYASSLNNKKIYKLSLESGKEIKKIGYPGWNPNKNQYLWPTAISPLSENSLLVSDAHTGYILIIDASSLKVKKYFGGNGYGLNAFNMPYAVISANGKFVVVSTFQKRILIGNIKNWTVDKNLVYKKSWLFLEKKIKPDFTPEYKKYVKCYGPSIDFIGREFFLKYGGIVIKDNSIFTKFHPSKRLNFNVFELSQLFNSSVYLYFINTITYKNILFVFSPQSTNLLSYSEHEGIPYLLPSKIPQTDCWENNNKLLSPQGELSMEPYANKFSEIVRYITKHRYSNGLLDAKYFLAAILNSREENVYLQTSEVKTIFQSNPGKEFYERYKKLDRNSSAKQVQEIAKSYFSNIKLQSNKIRMEEFISAAMLSGFPIKKIQIILYK